MMIRTPLLRRSVARTAFSSSRLAIVPRCTRFNSSSSPPATPPELPLSLDIDTSKRHAAPSSFSSSNSEDMSLADIVRKTIDAAGPMPLQRYMTLCLSHPTLGYYTRGDVFGNKGDFITSPEISQVFGELMAIWFLTRWQANGMPSKVRLLELGPGRGTLMADILRTLKAFPAVANSIEAIDLIETSPAMKALQQEALGKMLGGIEMRWWDNIEQVPNTDAFTFFVAHEFFDALPIHLLERVPLSTPSPDPDASSEFTEPETPKKAPFHELLVNHTPPSPALHFSLSPKPTNHSKYLPTTSSHFGEVEVGDRVEICPGAYSVMRVLGELIIGEGEGKGGGCGLVVDYGRDGYNGESFRAFKSHQPVSPFDTPGLADLTANVDFAYLREALLSSPHASHLRPLGPIPQGEFLTSLGLEPRLEKLVANAESEERKELLRAGGKRLVDDTGMGAEYLVMGLESPRPGLEKKGPEEGNAFGGLGEDIYPFFSDNH